jgi:hypothetical protein
MLRNRPDRLPGRQTDKDSQHQTVDSFPKHFEFPFAAAPSLPARASPSRVLAENADQLSGPAYSISQDHEYLRPAGWKIFSFTCDGALDLSVECG